MKKTKLTEDWEKEFDRKFGIYLDDIDSFVRKNISHDIGSSSQKIKDFIRSLLKEQKEEGYRKGRKEALEEQKELNYWISLARARGMNPEAFNIFWKSKQKEV